MNNLQWLFANDEGFRSWVRVSTAVVTRVSPDDADIWLLSEHCDPGAQTAKIAELEAEVSSLVGQLNNVEGSLFVERRTNAALRARVDELAAERDELNALAGTAPGTNGIPSEATLLPCPFCGCEDIDEYEGDYGNGVYCMNCGAMMGEPIHMEFHVHERVTYEQAAEAWNTRAAVTDHDFAMAVHDGKLWGKCSERGDAIELANVRTMLEERLRGVASDMRSIGASSMTPHELFAYWAREVDKAADLAATLGGGECENVSDEPQHFQCSECRSRGNVRKVFDNGEPLSFCPDCGARIRKAVKR